MNKVQRHRNIRAAMVRRGIKSSDIARELKITRQAVYMIISGRKNSRRIVAALIEAGVPARMFGKAAPSPQPSPAKGEGDKEQRRTA